MVETITITEGETGCQVKLFHNFSYHCFDLILSKHSNGLCNMKKIKCEILSHAFLYFEMKKSSMPLVWVCAHTSKPSGYNSFKISSHRKC